ncbi:hypothetical protein ACSBR2_006112 [Camellia fascicularis]
MDTQSKRSRSRFVLSLSDPCSLSLDLSPIEDTCEVSAFVFSRFLLCGYLFGDLIFSSSGIGADYVDGESTENGQLFVNSLHVDYWERIAEFIAFVDKTLVLCTVTVLSSRNSWLNSNTTRVSLSMSTCGLASQQGMPLRGFNSNSTLLLKV